MTILRANKTVKRETSTIYRARPLMVTLTPRLIQIREKGRRDAVEVDYAAVYEMAMRMKFRREQAEKNSRGKRR